MGGKVTAISGIVFSGALALYASAGWSQQTPPGDKGGTTGNPSQSESGKLGQSGKSSSGMSQSPSGEAPGDRGGTTGNPSQSESGKSAQSGRSESGMRGGMSRHGSDDNVKQVQEALKSQGHDPGPVDGVMGPKTRQALRAFQKSKNMQASGQLDSQTASALGVSTSGTPGSSSGSSSMGGSSPSATGSSPSPSRSGSSSSGSSGTMPDTGTSSSAPDGTGSKSGTGGGSGTSTGSSGSER